jgi:hypothetical protein
VNDREMDDLLKKAGGSGLPPEPALLDRIAGSIQPTMRPVRPLPSAGVLRTGLMAICVAVAVAGAARLGFFGIHAMSNLQMLIVPLLVGLILSAAATWVAEMIPGSKRRESARGGLFAAVLEILVLFAILFRDHHTENFVHAGLACLVAGLLHAIPIAIAGWWLVRRGFAVNPTHAALAAGTLAGLGGILMLELHCPNFEVSHLLVWHTAVIPASAALAVLFAKLVQIWRARLPGGR